MVTNKTRRECYFEFTQYRTPKCCRRVFAPTDFEVTPGDTTRKYVLDQPGVIHVFDDGEFRNEPFLDIRDRVVELYTGHDERGLLGIAFHPKYEENRKFYVRYSALPRDDTPEGWNHSEVFAEFQATEDGDRAEPESERILMEIPHLGAHHNAGQMAFGPDGYLYVGMGDGYVATSPKEELINKFEEGGDQELPTPKHFEDAVQGVTEEDVAEAVVTGPDPQPYIEKVQEYLDAGFDHVYFQQTGPNQEEAIEFFQREVVPEFA